MVPLARMILRESKVKLKQNLDRNLLINIHRPVAMQCIGEAFGVDASDEAQKELYSTKPATLLSIFDVYLKTKKSTAAAAKVITHVI
jgi:hypothetical protein